MKNIITNIKNSGFILLFSFLFLFFLSAGNAFASVAELNWQPNGEPDLGGYKIYWGTSPRTGTTPRTGGYANQIDVKNVTKYKIDSLPDTGTIYFSITAYDNNSTPNESAFSSEVKKKPGDINKDSSVNLLDFGFIQKNFNSTGCGNTADINLDCKVNLLDFGALQKNYGNIN